MINEGGLHHPLVLRYGGVSIAMDPYRKDLSRDRGIEAKFLSGSYVLKLDLARPRATLKFSAS